MRKYLLLSLFVLITISAFSQNRKIEIYCTLSSENTHYAEYGKLQKILPDSLARLHLIHPLRRIGLEISAINFMSFYGWTVVSAMEEHRELNSTRPIKYLLKKEIEITEQDSEYIIAQYESMKE